MAPKFSIVTPSFKQLEWLKLCAASVADQDGVVVEHLVQDAGTGPELDAWAACQPRLNLRVERDEGMYDAINRGLKRSTGELCAYLNCDEQYLPGALQKAAACFEAHPQVEVIFGDAVVINGDGRPLSYRRVVLPGILHTRLSHLDTLSCATFFRRTVVERGFLFDPRYRAIGDGVWMHALLAKGVRMAVLREPLAVFTVTGQNLGNATASQLEMDGWRNAEDAPPAFLHLPAILWHRTRKLFAGAYLPRSFEVRVYTQADPHHRTAFRVPRFGFGWPKQ